MKKSNFRCAAESKSTNQSSGVKPVANSPVSQKFYRYMVERITDACHLLGGRIQCDEVLTVVRGYLYAGQLPASCADTEILLIFTLLRPEIDKAMARTAAARLRAAARGRKNRSKTPDHVRSESRTRGESRPVSTGSESEAAPRKSRSERRRDAQKIRRASRRRVKPLAGKQV